MTLATPETPAPRRHGMASAGAWSVGGKLAARLFDLTSLVVLTAILMPADFGLVAKAMTVVVLVEMVTQMPIEAPILRVRRPERTMYDTAFTLTLIRATAIALLLIALSGPLAIFFKDPRLQPLVCWLALAPALRGCMSPRMAERTRAYDMRPEAVMEITSKILSLAIVTGVALLTRSYWAIAVGTITTSLVLNVASYVIAPYRPRLSLKHWPEFRDIATWVTLSQGLQAINWQLDNFILGRVLGNDAFGRFAVGRQLSEIPFQAMAFPLTRPMMTAFAEAEDDPSRRQLWLRFSNLMLFAVGPIFVTIAMLADGVIFVLLGGGWDGAGLVLAGLALATLPVLPAQVLNPLAASIFRTKLIAIRIAVQFALSVPLMLAGALWAGVLGVIAARVVINMAVLIYVLGLVRGQIGLPVATQLRAFWRSVVGLLVLVVVLFFAGDAFAPLTDGNRITTAVRLAVIGLAALALYLATCVGLWAMTHREDGAESYLWARIAPRLRGRGRPAA